MIKKCGTLVIDLLLCLSSTDTRNAADGRHGGGNHGRGGSYRHGRGKLFDSVLQHCIFHFIRIDLTNKSNSLSFVESRLPSQATQGR